MNMEMVLSIEVLRMFKHLSLFTYPYISTITTSEKNKYCWTLCNAILWWMKQVYLSKQQYKYSTDVMKINCMVKHPPLCPLPIICFPIALQLHGHVVHTNVSSDN